MDLDVYQVAAVPLSRPVKKGRAHPSGFHALHASVARAHRQDPLRTRFALGTGGSCPAGGRVALCCELPQLGAQAPKDRARGTLAFLSRLAFRVASTPKSEALKGRRFAGPSVLGEGGGGSPLAGHPVTDRLGAVWPGDGGESLKPGAGPWAGGPGPRPAYRLLGREWGEGGRRDGGWEGGVSGECSFSRVRVLNC